MEKRKAILSILRRARILAVLAGLLVLLSASTSLLYIESEVNEDTDHVIQNAVRVNVSVLDEQIASYRRLLSSIASRTEVYDLLILGDHEDAYRWSLEQRRYIPDGIGLALVDYTGEVLGEPGGMRLGPECVSDLKKITHGAPIKAPPVHRNIVSLEHFDLIIPISDESGVLMGAVFASFSLDIVANTIRRLAKDDQYLELRDGDNQVIASSRDNFSGGDFLTVEKRLPNSDWMLSVSIPKYRMQPTYIITGLLFTLLAFVIGVFVVRFSEKTCSDFQLEFARIQRALGDIINGDYHGNTLEPKFIETMEILPAIDDLSSKINEQRNLLSHLSQTDELTGLPNRRKFNIELERARSLAKRGIDVCMIQMDLDYFKAVNDKHGHESGDKVLRAFADSLNQHIRKSDVAARFGGDEFFVLLVQADIPQAKEWFQRVQLDFRARQRELCLGDTRPLCTISAGLVRLDPGSVKSCADELKNADKALYSSKGAGRNQLNVAE